MRVPNLLAWSFFLLLGLGAGCDSPSSGPAVSGTVTLHADDGVDLHSGKVQTPGNFKNSDLYASSNGSSLELASGGATPTQNRPVNWFVTPGGVNETFESLAAVPDDLPSGTSGTPLVHAKTGNGFVVERKDGGYSKGWVKAADATSVTIEFAPLAE
ncbi:MAG: hypothetical protein U1F43_08435 [Myxococcota bacterium]